MFVYAISVILNDNVQDFDGFTAAKDIALTAMYGVPVRLNWLFYLPFKSAKDHPIYYF